MTSAPTALPEIVVDLAAIRHNVRWLASRTEAAMMAVVKADAYGHGMVEVARAAREAGADWLGVATLAEAVELRRSGDRGRLLAWIAAPGADYDEPLSLDVDVAAYSVAQLAEIDAAAARVGRRARVHLKIDTGLSRGGATRADWDAVVAAAAAADHLDAVAVWSHLACADDPDHPATKAQVAVFDDAVAVARAAGLPIEVRHLANSAGLLLHPDTHYDLVRCGIATYGLDPAPGVTGPTELVPAMTVRGPVLIAKQIPAGAGVSYGHTFVAPDDMRVAVVPMGYGDGIPRAASSTAQVSIGGARRQVLGRICMDQFVVEGDGVEAGEEAVLFGPGLAGEPTAQDWAEWCDTISYEIVTRMGGRQRRVHVDSETAQEGH